LRSRLLPRRHHRPLGSRAVVRIRSLRAECRGVPRPVKPHPLEHRSLPIPIHSSPARLLTPSPSLN
jgi:hypothetical protein